MLKRYFIWKDPDCNGENVEWVEITGKEFYLLCNSTERKHYFTKIDEGKEDGMEVYCYEATYEKYLIWDKKRKKEERKHKDKKEFEPQIVSLDCLVSPDSDLTFNETIQDEKTNIEEEVIKTSSISRFREIRKTLTFDEQKVIDIILSSIETDTSERKICREKEIPHSSFTTKKEKIFEKIKKSYGQN